MIFNTSIINGRSRLFRMNEGKYLITEPDYLPVKNAVMCRIPTRVLDQIQEGLCRIQMVNPNKFLLINNEGVTIGTFSSAGDVVPQTGTYPLKSILKFDGEIFSPAIDKYSDFTFKTERTLPSFDKDDKKKNSKKSKILYLDDDISSNNNLADVSLGWSSQKAFGSLLSIRKRFLKAHDAIDDLINDIEKQIEMDPTFLDDSSILNHIHDDLENWHHDMKESTKLVQRLNKAIK